MHPTDAPPFSAGPRILLTGVFGPFARDDEYGSRKVNPMELYHNQVTRVQGPFSLRMFHRTLGLLMIEANIDAPCTILDFPTLDRFIREISTKAYEIIGISSIVPNLGKVKEMCRLIRRHQPRAVIVVGGHIASKDGLAGLIDADHICKGDGIRWFREYLGQDPDAPILHPKVLSGFGTRFMGLPVSGRNMAAVLIPSVGCPVGCNFCSTSALFGGKGSSISFYETGDELYSVLTQIEESLGAQSFFVLDENFLLYRQRALRLLELMQANGKSWAFYVFSSGRVLRSYSIEQLVGLGIAWVWLGLEGKNSRYSKLDGVDTRALVREFQSHGIRVLGSTIIGMEEHTPENIDAAIQYAVEHNTDFHQFMLYTPMPGTPLYRQHQADSTLLSDDECPPADVHGQERFNYRHPHIRDGQENGYLLRAFRQDFAINGPSVARIARTTLRGWQRYKNHADPRIARRFRNGVRGLASAYVGAVWAMARWYRDDAVVGPQMTELLRDLYREFGWRSRLLAPAIGRVMLAGARREQRKLESGWTYEPSSVYEKNAQARELEKRKFAPAGSRGRGLRLPAYDLAAVMNNCRRRMEDVRLGIHGFRDHALGHINRIEDQLRLYREQAREQAHLLGANLAEKRDQAGDTILAFYSNMIGQCEHEAEEIVRIQKQMLDKGEQLRAELAGLREQFKQKYRNAGDSIDQLSDQVAARYALAQQQIDEAVQRARLTLHRTRSQLLLLQSACLYNRDF
jgi:hypothetical protein